eukprot:scaffold76220_cov72-Phaeocystis_antarctica.AAC.3
MYFTIHAPSSRSAAAITPRVVWKRIPASAAPFAVTAATVLDSSGVVVGLPFVSWPARQRWTKGARRPSSSSSSAETKGSASGICWPPVEAIDAMMARRFSWRETHVPMAPNLSSVAGRLMISPISCLSWPTLSAIASTLCSFHAVTRLTTPASTARAGHTGSASTLLSVASRPTELERSTHRHALKPWRNASCLANASSSLSDGALPRMTSRSSTKLNEPYTAAATRPSAATGSATISCGGLSSKAKGASHWPQKAATRSATDSSLSPATMVARCGRGAPSALLYARSAAAG